MPKDLIKAFPDFTRPELDGPESSFLRVSEFFMDTLQGENLMGYPAAFLRVQDCTMNCIWCDTRSVWKRGNPYAHTELLDIMEDSGLVAKLRDGQHLVLTGGSPLKQQDKIVALMELFMATFNFKPYIEVENECTILPSKQMIKLVDCWNNSPKLQSSKNPYLLRYQPAVLKVLAGLGNAWFKFVIGDKNEWEEIERDFLIPGLIDRGQIVIMPLGVDQEELSHTRELAAELAIEKGVRFSDRLQVTIWNKATGV